MASPTPPASTKPKEKFWEENRGMFELVFLLSLVVHAIDVFVWKFELNVANSIGRALIYFILAIFAHLAFKQDLRISVKEFGITSIIPIIIYPVITAVLKNLSLSVDTFNLVGALMAAFPAWIIYMRYYKGINFPFSQGGFFESMVKALVSPIQWSKLWMGFWIAAILFNFFVFTITSFSGLALVQGSGIDPAGAIQSMTKYATDTITKAADSIRNLGTGIQDAYKRYMNETLGSYYTGRVEENKKQTGVFLLNFKALGKYYEDMPIDLSALVKVRSFVDQVNISFNCTATDQKNKSHVVQGKTDPVEQQGILQEDQQYVFCSFDNANVPGNGLPAGSYKISLNASFNFQTWAYTTYVFMDREVMAYMLGKGENINTKLDIPAKPVTIYTSGPVKMGMNEMLDMPIPLNNDLVNPSKIPVGITIDNANTVTGVVKRINRYELRVPQYFTLPKCTRDAVLIGSDPDVPGYSIYSFENKNFYDMTFLTVTCNMQIDKDGKDQLLRDTSGVKRVSIAGMADYIYDLSVVTTIKVEKKI